MDNVKTSMFNNDRCYVYNKAFAVYENRNMFDQLKSQLLNALRNH
jgi:hypothetical protein